MTNRRSRFATWVALATCALGVHADERDGALDALKARIAAGEIPGIHSVIVVRDGTTIAQWYFDGVDVALGPKGPVPLGKVAFDANDLHDVRSVTKSVVSILFGIAQADGVIPDLDAPVLDYFPEYADLRSAERLKIRVRDVLTMTSGWHWDERTYPYTDVRNSEIAMDVAPDPIRYVLSQAIDAPPGTRFTYSGGDVAVVGAIVTRATKTPLETFARQRLFAPLGIDAFEWSKNNGVPRAASGLRLRPRDMAKIGGLMLDSGRFDGQQIVPQSWVTAATTPHVDVDPPDARDPECRTRYGYLWWLGADCEVTPHVPWFAGIGNGGQRIWVMPSRKLVVVSTAGLYDDPHQGEPPAAVLTGVLRGLAR